VSDREPDEHCAVPFLAVILLIVCALLAAWSRMPWWLPWLGVVAYVALGVLFWRHEDALYSLGGQSGLAKAETIIGAAVIAASTLAGAAWRWLRRRGSAMASNAHLR
jgi:hypothetical protein